METVVQKISKEMIIPSSQTPNHLKNLRFSYLDQLINPVYIPLIFFYRADEFTGLTTSKHVEISQKLKQSLSQTLTSFYPLAGRIKDNLSVDCNDAGVEFITAGIHANLITDIIQSEELSLKQYIPFVEGPRETRPVCLVQITFFNCGGIALGICFSHKLADCASITAFIDAWAATCRGEAAGISPLDHYNKTVDFNLASYFPAKEIPGSGVLDPYISDEKYITKGFVFDEKKMEALRRRTVSDQVPTRVELVTAFIWKHLTESVEKSSVFAAGHMVNLRARHEALRNVFGNCVMSSLAFTATANADLVSSLRKSTKRVDKDYITEAQNGDNYLKDLMDNDVLKGEMEYCLFSSWTRFAVYEIDYGWGKPVWCATTALPLKNLTVLMNTRCGKGIEAWVNMEKENLQILEAKIKLISLN